MSLLHLDIRQLRNLRHVSLHFDPRINLIIGPNASGKTSLLEAIHLLGRGCSFRTARGSDLISHGNDHLTIAGKVFSEGREVSVGIGFHSNQRQIRLDGRTVQSRTELIRMLPTQFIDPTFHTLLENAPRARRKFLDWGVFYAEPDYLTAWRSYQRALAQRNAGLRARNLGAAKLWGRELVKYGKIIEVCRSRYLGRLQVEFCRICGQLGIGQEVELRYLPGRASGKDIETALADDLERDVCHGCTQSGPHRDDFMVYFAGRPVRHLFSRGQMKLLAYALALVQIRLLERSGCLLIDDLTSELDFENQALLTELLVHTQFQIFITATRPLDLTSLVSYAGRTFQVDRGVINPV